jgi:CubicO group peptidase (beta-lactamase class C family)
MPQLRRHRFARLRPLAPAVGLATLLGVLGAPPLSSQPEPSPLADHPRVAEAVRLLEAWMDGQRVYEQVPGMSAAVVHDGQLVWSRGFGVADREEGTPATPDTVYSICSISKLFTSIAVMRLRDAGELSLADPVGDLLPWFDIAQAYPDGPPVTVWGLLTHSAGLPRESDVPYWSAPDFTFPTRDEVRERLGDQETLYPAARHYQYSNLGLTLAGEIVAELSGRPFDDYVRAEILEPLGMTSTRTRMPTRDEEPRLAAGYASLDRNAERRRVPPFDAAGIGPAAGFSSTAHDLASFAAWQIRLLDGDPPADVLSANTLREMQRVQWLEPDWELARGLGFGVYKRGDHLYVGHSGSCPGYRSTVLVEHATGVGAAVLANAMVGVESYARRVHEILGPALAEAAEDAEEPAEPAEPGELDQPGGDPPDRERFTGTYSSQPWGGEAVVVPWKEGLAVVYLPGDDPLDEMDELRFVDPEEAGNDRTFRRLRDDGELGETVVFEVDDTGRGVAIVQHSNRYPRID